MLDKKQALILSSFRLFYEKGFHACGVELLAQNAGTTKRTLYSYFPSKEELIAAVLVYRHEQFMHQLQEFFTRYQGEVITVYLDFLQQWTNEPYFNGCLFINACAEYADNTDPIHLAASKHKQAVRDFLYQQCTLQQKMNAQAIAETLFLIGEGIIVDKQTGGNTAVNIDNVRKTLAILFTT